VQGGQNCHHYETLPLIEVTICTTYKRVAVVQEEIEHTERKQKWQRGRKAEKKIISWVLAKSLTPLLLTLL
jgi:hypothetical protein